MVRGLADARRAARGGLSRCLARAARADQNPMGHRWAHAVPAAQEQPAPAALTQNEPTPVTEAQSASVAQAAQAKVPRHTVSPPVVWAQAQPLVKLQFPPGEAQASAPAAHVPWAGARVVEVVGVGGGVVVGAAVVVVAVGAGVVVGVGVGVATVPVQVPGGMQRLLPLPKTQQTQPGAQTPGLAAQTLLPHWACVTWASVGRPTASPAVRAASEPRKPRRVRGAARARVSKSKRCGSTIGSFRMYMRGRPAARGRIREGTPGISVGDFRRPRRSAIPTGAPPL